MMELSYVNAQNPIPSTPEHPTTYPEPVDPADPTEPNNPEKPIQPADPEEPTQPHDLNNKQASH